MNNSSQLLLWVLGIFGSTVAREALVGGIKAKAGEFPYQVAIIDPYIGLVCGGCIIDEQFVLTAASCVVEKDGKFRGQHLNVLAGTTHVLNNTIAARTIAVKKIYVPVEYTKSLARNTGELAVLKLEKPLIFSQLINKMQLPVASQPLDMATPARIAGFGWSNIRLENQQVVRGSNNHQLLYSDADIINDRQEKHILARTHQYIMMPSAVRSKHRSPCIGDLGGPLIQNHRLIGILSWIPDGCVESRSSSIYTRVSHYLNFIHDAIHDRSHMFMRALTLYP